LVNPIVKPDELELGVFVIGGLNSNSQFGFRIGSDFIGDVVALCELVAVR